MTALYKVTAADGRTRGGTQWGPGVTVTLPPSEHPRLCTGDVIHAHRDATLGLVLNQGGYAEPVRLWRAEGDVVAEEWDKIGSFSLTTVEELPLPAWYADPRRRRRVRVRFGLACAEAVSPVWEAKYPDDARPRKAIQAGRAWLAAAAYAAADADAAAAAHAAAAAAHAAAAAAHAATYAAAAAAADAAYAAAAAATEAVAYAAAAHAAYAAAAADDAYAAAGVAQPDFVGLAHQAASADD